MTQTEQVEDRRGLNVYLPCNWPPPIGLISEEYLEQCASSRPLYNSLLINGLFDSSAIQFTCSRASQLTVDTNAMSNDVKSVRDDVGVLN